MNRDLCKSLLRTIETATQYLDSIDKSEISQIGKTYFDNCISCLNRARNEIENYQWLCILEGKE